MYFGQFLGPDFIRFRPISAGVGSESAQIGK